MAYATNEDYKRIFEVDIKDRYLDEAAILIDSCTFGRITDFAALSDKIKGYITKANCYAARHRYLLENYSKEGDDGDIRMVKIGDLTISKFLVHAFVNESASKNKNIAEIGSIAFKLLMLTGLMFRGVDVSNPELPFKNAN
jgi:hypothetical protein